MKNRILIGIFFFLFVLSTSGVFAAMVGNSRQGLPAISVTSQPGSTDENPGTHQGSGLCLRIFTANATVGFNGGMNLYRYADNNPMRWVDPWGLFKFVVWNSDTRSSYAYLNTFKYSGGPSNFSSEFIEAWVNERGCKVYEILDNAFRPEQLPCIIDSLKNEGLTAFRSLYPEIDITETFVGSKYVPMPGNNAVTGRLKIFAPIARDLISNGYIGQLADTYQLVPSTPYFILTKPYSENTVGGVFNSLFIEGGDQAAFDNYVNQMVEELGFEVPR